MAKYTKGRIYDPNTMAYGASEAPRIHGLTGDLNLTGPRFKNQYFVVFRMNGNHTTFDNRTATHITHRVKSFDAPRFSIETEAINQYNKHRILPTKIEFDPITVVFHDDRSNIVQDFWKKIYNYYFKNGMFKADKDDGYSTTVSDKIIESDVIGGAVKPGNVGYTYENFGYNLYNKLETKNLFSFMSLYLVASGQYTRIDLVNPYVSSMQHDTFSQEEHSTVGQITMQWVYETVVYKGNGLVNDEGPLAGLLNEEDGIFHDGWNEASITPSPENRDTSNKSIISQPTYFGYDDATPAKVQLKSTTGGYMSDFFSAPAPEKKEVEEGQSHVDTFDKIHTDNMRNLLATAADFGADAKEMESALDRSQLAQAVSAKGKGYKGPNMNEKVVKYVKTARTTGLENRFVRGAVSKPDGGIGAGGRFKTSAKQKVADAAYDTELEGQAAVKQQQAKSEPEATVTKDGFRLTSEGYVLTGDQTPSLMQTIENWTDGDPADPISVSAVIVGQLAKMGIAPTAFEGASGQLEAQIVIDLLTGDFGKGRQQFQTQTTFEKVMVSLKGGSSRAGETDSRGMGATNEQVMMYHGIVNMSAQDAKALTSAVINAGKPISGDPYSEFETERIEEKIAKATGTGEFSRTAPAHFSGPDHERMRAMINNVAQRRGLLSPSSIDPDAIGTS